MAANSRLTVCVNATAPCLQVGYRFQPLQPSISERNPLGISCPSTLTPRAKQKIAKIFNRPLVAAHLHGVLFESTSSANSRNVCFDLKSVGPLFPRFPFFFHLFFSPAGREREPRGKFPVLLSQTIRLPVHENCFSKVPRYNIDKAGLKKREIIAGVFFHQPSFRFLVNWTRKSTFPNRGNRLSGCLHASVGILNNALMPVASPLIKVLEYSRAYTSFQYQRKLPSCVPICISKTLSVFRGCCSEEWVQNN